jgi:hypothetical protein
MSERVAQALLALFWMSAGSVLTLFVIALILKATVKPVRYTRPLPMEIVKP